MLVFLFPAVGCLPWGRRAVEGIGVVVVIVSVLVRRAWHAVAFVDWELGQVRKR